MLVDVVMLAASWPRRWRPSPLARRRPRKTVADGVYTDAQANRGAAAYDGACSGCHRADLGGGSGPALKEQRFARELRRQRSEDAVHEDRDDDAAQRAGEPRRQRLSRHRRAHVERERIPGGRAGARPPMRSTAIRVVPGRPKPPPPVGDFSYVEVVGCLTAGPQHTWMLTRASEPVAVGPRLGAGAGLDAGRDRDSRSARRRFTCWMRWRTRPTITKATRCTSAGC